MTGTPASRSAIAALIPARPPPTITTLTVRPPTGARAATTAFCHVGSDARVCSAISGRAAMSSSSRR